MISKLQNVSLRESRDHPSYKKFIILCGFFRNCFVAFKETEIKLFLSVRIELGVRAYNYNYLPE